MKLEVPFVRGLKKWKGNGWCGPLSLACVLRYYGFNESVEDIVKMAKTSKFGGTVPNGLINICLKKGLSVDYYSEDPYEKNDDIKYDVKIREFFNKIDAETTDKFFYEENKKFKEFKWIKGGCFFK